MGKKPNTLDMEERSKRLGIERVPPDDPIYTGRTIQRSKNLQPSLQKPGKWEPNEKDKGLLTIARESEQWLSAARASDIDVSNDAELYDFCREHIENEGDHIKTYEAWGGYGEFFVDVIGFAGVFMVQALDIDTEDFHLSLEDALGEAEDIASCYQSSEDEDS